MADIKERKETSNTSRIAVIIALVGGALLALGFLTRWPW